MFGSLFEAIRQIYQSGTQNFSSLKTSGVHTDNISTLLD